MSLLLSERPVDLPAESTNAESESDSGVGSPVEEAGMSTTTVDDAQGDSDEDIAVKRTSRHRKVLQDSDSEKEDGARTTEALVLSESSGEETQTSGIRRAEKSRIKRISRVAVDGDESETERFRGEAKRGKKKREKSQRRKEKEQRRGAVLKRLKEKESPLPKALNDSGCLLGDSDLFDAQLEDNVSDGKLEEEESLDTIRDAMKQKANHKQGLHDDEYEADDDGPQRKERKAAKASKEAIKQLHSDSQRLVRECTIGLPYHIPEPKGIHQFFKNRARPVGPAMALLKSVTYQPCVLEASGAAHSKCNQSQTPGHNTNPQADLCLNRPNAASCAQPQDATHEQETSAAIKSTEDQPGVSSKAELQNCTEEENTIPEEKAPERVGSLKREEEEEEQVPVQQAVSGTVDLEQVASALAAPGPAVAKPRKDKLARLRELGLEPPPVAKLCADDGAFVQLECPQANPALEALKERFLRHVQPAPRSRGERALNISVVRKDSTPSGKEELHTESITVTVNEEEEEPAHSKPGEKLVLLKSRLQQAMAVRRQEERERRAALHRLDNEVCEEEEEEEEMTESEEEEGVDELLGNGENGEGHEDEGGKEREEVAEAEGGEAAKKRVSPCFKSPSPTPDADGTLMLFAGSSCSRTGDFARQVGQESDNRMEDEDALSLTKDNSHNSSFELIASTLPSYQPLNRAAGRGVSAGVFRSPSPCLFRQSFLGSASKSSGKLSEPSLSLPVEDSQDLYAMPSPGELAPLAGGDSQGPFSLEEDTQSQLLDADGFLNVGPRGGPRRSHKRQLILESLDENAMDANMGELLGLCSGGFGSGQSGADDELLGLCSGGFSTQPGAATDTPGQGSRQRRPRGLDGGPRGTSDGDMDQLLALCSGEFTASPGASSERSVSSSAFENATDRGKKEEEEEEEEENCEFRLLSDVDSASEKEDEEDSDGEIEGEVEEEERVAVFGPRQGKRKIHINEFVDSEAELSGSDVGSEGEDDEGADEYEEEELQEDLPSDEELMDQVNKIHMKQVLDDDKQKLRLYQERYLADGDLHSDGPGRERRFRWKNIDDGFEFGVGDGQEEEEDEELDQNDLQRQKERLEREQWLREQSDAQAKNKDLEEDEEKIGEEDSQFMKLAKKLTARTLQKRETPPVPLQEKAASNLNPFQKPCQTVTKRGSLLSQPKAVLQKLASISDGNPLAPRNTRGFLFHTLSPEKESPASSGPRKQFKKRGQTESLASVAKRPCLENSKSPGCPRSIFSYLEN